MIQSVNPEQYPELLDVQIACIRSLGGTYSQDEIAAWVGYLEQATPERFAMFQNRASLDATEAIEGFVSWTEDRAAHAATIECLYVREQYRGQGIGHLLLREAESAMTPGSHIAVRSTLNARSFYEKNGYTFKERGISRAGFAMTILDKVVAL